MLGYFFLCKVVVLTKISYSWVDVLHFNHLFHYCSTISPKGVDIHTIRWYYVFVTVWCRVVRLFFPLCLEFLGKRLDIIRKTPYNYYRTFVLLILVNNFRIVNRGDFITTEWVSDDVFRSILMALMPQNRLALLTSLITGLRIDDVLHLKSEVLLKDRFTVKEMKTGKTRRVRLPSELRDELFRTAGRFYIFEGRLTDKKPRSRQAVYKDLKRACEAFRITVNVAPHTARKIFAVSAFQRTGNLQRVQQLLNHSDEAVTVLYAMADELTKRHRKK